MVIISTKHGRIKGVQESNYQYFLGIPYAKPPVGDLRFCEPQAMEPWGGIKDTTKFGPIAPQNHQGDMPLELVEDEDCLHLNIWAPSTDKKARPVMFWIHGGGFLTSASSRPRFNGASLAAHGNVIVVNFNYRLGSLGFLDLPGIPPNIGIQDQIAALNWVRDNIKAFGGDPNNITIFGESAGAMSVAILLAIPATKNSFHRAIMESGATNPRDLRRDISRKGAEKFLSKLHIEKGDINALREVPWKKLMRVQKKIAGTIIDGKTNPFRPFIDGKIIPEQPLEIIRKGNNSKVPLIIGFNEDELSILSFYLDKVDEGVKKAMIEIVQTMIHKNGINDKALEKLNKAYEQEMDAAYRNTPYKYLYTILSDSMFRLPIIRQLEAHTEHQSDIYTYIFSYHTPKYGGAFHTLEIPFVFGTLEKADIPDGAIDTDAETQLLAKKMMDSWVTFARTGNPNHDGLPEWPPYNKSRRATMILSKAPKVEFAPLDNLRELWENII